MTLEGGMSVGDATTLSFAFGVQPFAISGNLHEDLTLRCICSPFACSKRAVIRCLVCR